MVFAWVSVSLGILAIRSHRAFHNVGMAAAVTSPLSPRPSDWRTDTQATSPILAATAQTPTAIIYLRHLFALPSTVLERAATEDVNSPLSPRNAGSHGFAFGGAFPEQVSRYESKRRGGWLCCQGYG